MTVGEATRQYQATLEARRALMAHTDVVSFAEERVGAAAELAQARAQLERAWLEGVYCMIRSEDATLSDLAKSRTTVWLTPDEIEQARVIEKDGP